MNFRLLLFTVFFMEGCNISITPPPIIDTPKKIVVQQHDSSKNIIKKTVPELVHDTIVYSQNVIPPMLVDKYRESNKRLGYYRSFINVNSRNKQKTIREKYSETKIRYLGTIKILGTRLTYHVITNFTVMGIGVMPSPRGHSEIAFVDASQKKILIYDVEMPDNLPKRIKNNSLYFKSENGEGYLAISGGLPILLCVPTQGCY